MTRPHALLLSSLELLVSPPVTHASAPRTTSNSATASAPRRPWSSVDARAGRTGVDEGKPYGASTRQSVFQLKPVGSVPGGEGFGASAVGEENLGAGAAELAGLADGDRTGTR